MMKALALAVCLFSVSGAGAAVEPPASSEPRPQIDFASTSFDFGKIPTGQIVQHDFIFTNSGNAVLEIRDVHPGCGCTTAGNWDRSVPPGKTGKIPLQFNSAGFGGMVEKSATITCNDPRNPTTLLELSGTVWTPIQVTPSMAVFNVRSDSDKAEVRRLRIENNTDSPIALSDLKSSRSNVTADLKTITPGKLFELEVSVHPPFEPGTVIVPMTAATSLREVPVLNLSAYLIVQAPVMVSPAQLVLPDAGPAARVTNVVLVRNQTTNTLQLSDAAINIPGAQVQVVVTQPGQLADLNVTFPAGVTLKSGERYAVTAKTGIPSFPTIRIPVLQFAASETPKGQETKATVVPQNRAVLKRSSLKP